MRLRWGQDRRIPQMPGLGVKRKRLLKSVLTLTRVIFQHDASSETLYRKRFKSRFYHHSSSKRSFFYHGGQGGWFFYHGGHGGHGGWFFYHGGHGGHGGWFFTTEGMEDTEAVIYHGGHRGHGGDGGLSRRTRKK